MDKWVFGFALAGCGVVSTCALMLALRNGDGIADLFKKAPGPQHKRRLDTLQQELEDLHKAAQRDRADAQRLVDRVDNLYSKAARKQAKE